jgi:ABC-type spermidine/putrescine transport system permease subunit II
MFWTAICLLYLPLIYLVFQAFLENPNDWRGGFTLRWLIKLFDSPSLWEPLLNSVEIGVLSATLAVSLGTL